MDDGPTRSLGRTPGVVQPRSRSAPRRSPAMTAWEVTPNDGLRRTPSGVPHAPLTRPPARSGAPWRGNGTTDPGRPSFSAPSRGTKVTAMCLPLEAAIFRRRAWRPGWAVLLGTRRFAVCTRSCGGRLDERRGAPTPPCEQADDWSVRGVGQVGELAGIAALVVPGPALCRNGFPTSCQGLQSVRSARGAGCYREG